MRLLLLEEEQRLANRISTALKAVGFLVDYATNGLVGAALAEKDVFDTIILDLMLPGKDGRALLRCLREGRRYTPVLVIAAREAKESVVELLNSGADGYLEKPLDLQELIARVKALIRRSKGISTPVLELPEVEVDTVCQTVRRNGREIRLSPTEYRILEYLALRAGAIVSKRELLSHVQNHAWKHPENVIDVRMSNLRGKLNITGQPETIETLRRRGYRLRKNLPQ